MRRRDVLGSLKKKKKATGRQTEAPDSLQYGGTTDQSGDKKALSGEDVRVVDPTTPQPAWWHDSPGGGGGGLGSILRLDPP